MTTPPPLPPISQSLTAVERGNTARGGRHDICLTVMGMTSLPCQLLVAMTG